MHGLIVSVQTRKFNPSLIPGCVLWMRSDLGVSITGSKISAWKNQIAGIAGDATQNTAALQPGYAIDTGTGRPKIQFDGATSSRIMPWTFDFGGAKTIFAVMKKNTLGTGMTPFQFVKAAASATTEVLLDYNGGGYQPVTVIHDYVGSQNSVGHSASLGTTAIRAITSTWDGVSTAATGSYTGKLDNVTQSMLTGGAFAQAATSQIGGRNTSPSFYFDGDIYEIVVYNRVLSVAEQLDLWGYASKLYKL